MKVLAYNNPDAVVRYESSSGGAFSMLAEATLSEGGIVYGAVFGSNYRIEHRRIESVDELGSLRQSKYVYSFLGSAIKSITNDLSAGRKVLFCSVPCQVAAVRRKVGPHSKLLLIEVVCHGAPKPEHWQKYLEELCFSRKKSISEIKRICFRDKKTGWTNYSFTVEFNDGYTLSQQYVDNDYMRAFVFGYTLRRACFDCKYKYPLGSEADITLGDLWGIDKVAPTLANDDGTSLVILRSERGCELEPLFTDSMPIDFAKAVRFNPAVIERSHLPVGYDDFNRIAAKSFMRAAKKFCRQSLLPKLKGKIKNLLTR